MTSNTKKHGRQSTVDTFRRAQRAFEKGDYKQALKEAKVCYRQEPTEEHRALLERAWLARVKTLVQRGLRDEAKAAAEELLQFGVHDSGARTELPSVLLLVGLFDRWAGLAGKSTTGEASPSADIPAEWTAAAADHAVQQPADAPAALPGIREGALAVRKALDLLHEGQEGPAIAALQDIPRHSPFADWKYFVRGLAAYYRHDAEQMRANWDRLAPERAGSRVAAALRSLLEPHEGSVVDGSLTDWVVGLVERHLWGQPVSAHCAHFQKLLADDDWHALIRTVRTLQSSLSAAAPELWDRVRELLYTTVVHRGDPDLLNDLAKAMHPLPIDPQWNRARALIWERLEDGLDEAETYWSAYVDDLAKSTMFSAEERSLAQALVLERLGQQAIASGSSPWDDENDDSYDDEPYEDEEEEEVGQSEEDDWEEDDSRRAVKYLERALQLAPHLRSAHESLAQAYDSASQPERAAEARRRLLAEFPDDLAAMKSLFQYHYRRDQMIQARDYALQAYRLKPTSQELQQLVVVGRMGAARIMALDGRWDEARTELNLAEQSASSDIPRDNILVRRAMVEFKAGDMAAGRKWMDEALAMAGRDPAGVWFALTIEAGRYGLPKDLDGIAAEVEHRWQSEITKKCRSAAAGAMSERLASFLATEIDYPDRSYHVGRVLEYVRRCSRVRWAAEDLRNVCIFLNAVQLSGEDFPDQADLLKRLVDKGRRSFPQEAAFHGIRAQLEIARGSYHCDRRLAQQCFEQARQSAQQSGRPEDSPFMELADQGLAFLEHVQEMSAMPFGPVPFPLEEEEEDDSPGFTFGDIVDTIKRMAKTMGVNPERVLKDLEKEGIPGPHFGSSSEAEEKPASASRKRKR